MAKEKNECHVCGEETSDWYVVKTNKGNLYRCAFLFAIVWSVLKICYITSIVGVIISLLTHVH